MYSVCNIANSAYFVKSTPPRAFSFNTLQVCYSDLKMWKFNDEKIFFDKSTAFLT